MKKKPKGEMKEKMEIEIREFLPQRKCEII